MVRNTQDWTVGQVVKVGFLQLRVVSVKAVKDGLPDIYTLESIAAVDLADRRRYEFIPHNGLTRIFS